MLFYCMVKMFIQWAFPCSVSMPRLKRMICSRTFVLSFSFSELNTQVKCSAARQLCSPSLCLCTLCLLRSETSGGTIICSGIHRCTHVGQYSHTTKQVFILLHRMCRHLWLKCNIKETVLTRKKKHH